MAELLKREFQLECTLNSGAVGEFTVWLGPHKVAEKDSDGFPSEAEILRSVKELLKH